MGDSLHDWCIEKKQEHPELKFNCSSMDDTTTTSSLDLTEILTKSVINKLKNDRDNQKDEVDKEIIEKRKQVENLKGLIHTKNYDTHERRHQELRKMANKYYVNLIIYIILLVVAILMGIILIYYFFIYRKK